MCGNGWSTEKQKETLSLVRPRRDSSSEGDVGEVIGSERWKVCIRRVSCRDTSVGVRGKTDTGVRPGSSSVLDSSLGALSVTGVDRRGYTVGFERG